jgi:hypothetical protein
MSAIAVLPATILALQGPVPASATTGPTILPAPSYRVPLSQAQPFCGHYAMRHASTRARITASTMTISLNTQDVLVGLLQMYSTDAQHNATSWMATLYNFHLLANGRMGADLLGAGYSVQLGQLTLTRSNSGDLIGRITQDTQSYTMTWHRMTAPHALLAVPTW